MTWMEMKMEFFVASAKKHCGTESTSPLLRQMIAVDIVHCIGQLLEKRDPRLILKAGDLLAVFPLLKKDATGQFLEKLTEMEDKLLDIQVTLRSMT